MVCDEQGICKDRVPGDGRHMKELTSQISMFGYEQIGGGTTETQANDR